MKTLSIVIPVYNEEERLSRTFEALKKLQIPRGLKLEKVIFVNDGSTDKTVSVIRDQSSVISNKEKLKAKIEIVSYRNNKGKGYAVARGMRESASDYTLFADADMSTDMGELKKFVPFIERGIPIIIGTRKNSHSTVINHQPFLRELMGRGFTLLSNLVLNMRVTDYTCGFKAFERRAKDEIFPQLRSRGFGFDVEALFLSRVKGFDIAEAPVVWSHVGKSKVSLFSDSFRAFYDLLMIRMHYFIPQNISSQNPAYSPISQN